MAKTKNTRTLYKLNPKVKLLTDFYTFDTETGTRYPNGSIQWELKSHPSAFIFGVIHGLNYTKVLYSLEEMKTELKNPRYKNKYLFAHNCEYDLGAIYGNIFTDLDPEAIFNGKFISATNGNCLFSDSTNIFGRVKLETLGEMIGIKKPKLGNDTLFSESLGAEEINRCVTDCVILWQSLVNMFEFAGDIKITQASLSLTYFRRFHQSMNIEHNENTRFFLDSYFGGRTEAFKMGKTYSSVIDINSSYPYAMKVSKFPNPKFLKVETDCTPDKLVNYYFEHFEGLAYCTVSHPKIFIGLLPIKKDKKLIFPIGTFSGCWNFNELRFAVSMGVKIVNISKVVYSEPMPSPFESYVTTLYNERVTSTNDFEIYRIKIFMNSLYGKFAQRINEENIYIENIEKSLDLIHEYQRKKLFIKLQMFNAERNDAFLIIKSMTGQTLTYAIPSFSSYITSFGRVKLAEQLLKMENQKPVYCDTDSIFFEINNGFKSSNELGGWKLENKIVTEINGLKNYKFFKIEKPDKIITRIKGVPANATNIGLNKFSYNNLIKTKEGLRRGIESGFLTERIKLITNKYDKRIILTDGQTKPFEL